MVPSAVNCKDCDGYEAGYSAGLKDAERPQADIFPMKIIAGKCPIEAGGNCPLKSQGEWVPVSERLPSHDEYIKNNGLFNVSDGNRSYSEWFDIYDTQKFGEPTMTGFRVDCAVTAWQPLPEPYKKGGAEE